MTVSAPASVRLLRALRYDTAGQIAVQLAALGTGIVLARSLGPVDFGRLALVLAIASTAALLANLGGTETATRFVAELKAKGRLGELARLAWPFLAARFAASVIAGLAIVLLRGPVGDLIGLDGSFSMALALMAAVHAALAGLQGPSQVVLVNLDRQKFINTVTGLTNAAGFVSLLALAATTGTTVETAVLVVLLTLLARVMLFGWAAVDAVSDGTGPAEPGDVKRESTDLRRRMARYGAVMFLIGAGGFLLQSRSDEYFVGAILGVQAVAFYHLAEGFSRTAFSLPASRLTGFLVTGLLTEGYVQSGTPALQERFRQVVRLRFALSVPIGLGGALLANETVSIIYGPEYAAAAGFLALFFLLQMPLQWTGAVSGVLVAIERPHWFLWTKALSLITLPLTVWWLHMWGVEGAILATSLGMALAAGFEFFAARRLTGISFPVADVARYLVAGGLMAAPVAALAAFMPGPAWLTLAIAVPVGASAYAAALFALRAFTPDELAALKQLVRPSIVPRNGAPETAKTAG